MLRSLDPVSKRAEASRTCRASNRGYTVWLNFGFRLVTTSFVLETTENFLEMGYWDAQFVMDTLYFKPV